MIRGHNDTNIKKYAQRDAVLDATNSMIITRPIPKTILEAKEVHLSYPRTGLMIP